MTKGILKTFEAVLGLSLVMLTFVFLYTGQDPLPEFETVTWKISGMEGLESLDAANELRYDALNNNTAAIENKLKQKLPAAVDTLLQICELNCSVPEIDAEKSASVHYLVSGDANNNTAKELILYVWTQE